MNIEEKISEVREKVHKNQGKTIFCFREFSCSEDSRSGCFCPPHTSKYKYYDAGIIDGELNNERKILRIDIPSLSLGQNKDFYTLFGKFSIPVKRELRGFLGQFSSQFNFNNDDLEKICDGNIFFNDLELLPRSYFVGHSSILKKCSLLIGDDEVNNFFKEKKINPSQLFENLYHPEEVEKKLAIAKYKEKESFGNELVNSANELILNFRKVKKIENEVLNSRYIIEADQDGTTQYWNAKEVFEYSQLKDSIQQQIPKINSQLEKGNAFYPSGTDLPLIKGNGIGFPGAVTFLAYGSWLKDEKIPEINSTIEKINNHLREEKRK